MSSTSQDSREGSQRDEPEQLGFNELHQTRLLPSPKDSNDLMISNEDPADVASKTKTAPPEPCQARESSVGSNKSFRFQREALEASQDRGGGWQVQSCLRIVLGGRSGMFTAKKRKNLHRLVKRSLGDTF